MRVGQTVTSPKRYVRLLGPKATGRSFDDRVGCAALVLAVRRLDPSRLKHTVIFIWSVREEIGLDGILAASRRNNAKAGVTGLLLSGGRRFLQVLEGPESQVAATFARIAADPRHFAIVELSRREIKDRQFGNWAMAYDAGGEAGEGTDLREVVKTLIGPLADRNVRAQFIGFAEIHARAA